MNKKKLIALMITSHLVLALIVSWATLTYYRNTSNMSELIDTVSLIAMLEKGDKATTSESLRRKAEILIVAIYRANPLLDGVNQEDKNRWFERYKIIRAKYPTLDHSYDPSLSDDIESALKRNRTVEN